MTTIQPVCYNVRRMPRVKKLKDTTHVSLRVATDLLTQVQRHADDNHRTLSQEIRLALVKHVAEARA